MNDKSIGRKLMEALILAIVLIAPWAVIRFLSPRWLRWAAAWFMTRAEVIEEARRTREARMRHWTAEFKAE